MQAFTDLMNRALDKPKQQPIEVQKDVNINIHAEIRRTLNEALLREQKLIERGNENAPEKA